jgi:predicted MFS family arabinose efflux permease
MNEKTPILIRLLRIPVLVAALGYLVDMYDLLLFTIVRVPSLKSLGVSGGQLLGNGVLLLNLQMAGMLVGGLVWGITGDKKGRLSVLFGSILIYSLANIGNGLVSTVTGYAVMRFIAGFGLAGELGVGVTLVVESLPKDLRGYGTTIVATMGVFGALLAYLIAHVFLWRIAYFIGGGLGLLLMILRIRVFESGIFLQVKNSTVKRGDIRMLVNNKKRFLRYLNSILIGMPIWFISGILITFSPEFGNAMKIGRPIDAGEAVLFTFGAQVAGNILSGALSQFLKSRKKAILVFMVLALLAVLFYLLFPFRGPALFYATCASLGFFGGYWTLFITVAAELFGANLRATVATTVPNFVRSTVIPLTALFLLLKGQIGIIRSALYIALVTFGIAIFALFYLQETFEKDMGDIEEE